MARGSLRGGLESAAARSEMSWLARLVQAAKVGLAVVVSLLVSQVAQLLLALLGVVGFVLLSPL